MLTLKWLCVKKKSHGQKNKWRQWVFVSYILTRLEPGTIRWLYQISLKLLWRFQIKVLIQNIINQKCIMNYRINMRNMENKTLWKKATPLLAATKWWTHYASMQIISYIKILLRNLPLCWMSTLVGWLCFFLLLHQWNVLFNLLDFFCTVDLLALLNKSKTTLYFFQRNIFISGVQQKKKLFHMYFCHFYTSVWSQPKSMDVR